MAQNNASLVGSVFERNPISSPSGSVKFSNPGKTGFPAVQHRSKSAFARGRDDLRKSGTQTPGRLREVPVLTSAKVTSVGDPVGRRQPETGSPIPTHLDVTSGQDLQGLRQQIGEENELKVANMSEEEREQERRDIMERFGAGVGDLLKRVKEARDAKETKERVNRDALDGNSLTERQHAASNTEKADDIIIPKAERASDLFPARCTSPPSPRPILSTSSTRPSSRAGLKIRFADVTPENVHYYESAPPSPRKKILALPPPPDVPDGSTISLGRWKGKIAQPTEPSPLSLEPPLTDSIQQKFAEPNSENDPEEGTPEYIRRRFFPNVPAHDPSIAWMESSTDPSTSSLRFDLTGTPIPEALSSTLPTHLGLHHHADGSQAGYTLDDIFLLSRSTVPAQRATMVDVLSRIMRKLRKGKKGGSDQGIKELAGREEELRRRILAVGVEAMGERGSLGVRAIEAMWECIVGWDEGLTQIEGVELRKADGKDSNNDVLLSLPLDYLLPQISNAFATSALPSESLAQLLAIVHRLAQQSNAMATNIVTSPNLLSNLVRSLLLSSTPSDSSHLPDPSALNLLSTLALSSRDNAAALVGSSDAVLRFITMLPPNSPYPLPLANALITSTLQFYTTLASYGFYSHIATTASTYFLQVGTYVLSEECQLRSLMVAWTTLLEAWMVCATDPHRTTPNHEILWSQVVGWGWGEEVLELRRKLTSDEQDWMAWAGVWRAEIAWLEGARVNGMKGGETERSATLAQMKGGFEGGTEARVVLGAMNVLHRALEELTLDKLVGVGEDSIGLLRNFTPAAHAVTCAIRLWLACLPPSSSIPLASPPYLLPFSQLSELCGQLVSHPLWSWIYSEDAPSYSYVFCRPLTTLLSSYLRLSRRLPGTSEDLWMAQAFSIITRLLPGDEELGHQTVLNLTSLITGPFMASRGWHTPPIIFENGGMDVIMPFLTHALRPQSDSYIGPLYVSPESILRSTTLRLPPSSLRRGSGDNSSLPLVIDWVFSPLEHLLRSGSSAVFQSLPSSWDASEIDVVRATLLLARVAREVLNRYSLNTFVPTLEETVFACMKVFMLEHEQPQNDSQQEVFRDNIVGQFMDDLLAPFALAASSRPSPLPSPTGDDLEKVAARFLGPSTPFYQYYTDFIGLYDAVSFSNPLFARLLLPPTSMRYAPDYRKHLWSDFGHILKTIRTPIDQVIVGNIGEYFWPVETDAQMISSYLRALGKGSLQNFVRLVAVHHLACNIWPDLRDGEGDERAGKLLRAVADQGDIDAVRDVVLYRQTKDQVLLPPKCFEQVGEWKSQRLMYLGQLDSPGLLERLQGLLKD